MAKKKSNASFVWIVAVVAVLTGLYVSNSRGGDDRSALDTEMTAKAAPAPANQSASAGSDAGEAGWDENADESSSGSASVPAAAVRGLEIPRGGKGIVLTRPGYTVCYDASTRLPVWVAWHLTADHTDGPYKREGIRFAEDTDVPEPRATNADYTRSGYDRGHMCPSGDNRWSREAQLTSFLYTNCCPQLHSLNAGDWNELEQRCRDWARDYGDVYIVCGPLLARGNAHQTIGPNRVVVPERFFKVVLSTKGRPKAIGFIMNNARGNNPLERYVVTVDKVEAITGLDFFSKLPDMVEKQIEAKASLGEWR